MHILKGAVAVAALFLGYKFGVALTGKFTTKTA